MMIKELLGVFRPSRWYRNSFMLLGSILAIGITTHSFGDSISSIIIVFIALSLMTSANYGINEILDIETDRMHPQKKHRALVTGKVKIKTVLTISIILYALSIAIILTLGKTALTISLLLMLLSGIMYNVPPIRVKDIPYLDFLFEALNNPIRLLVGWFAVVESTMIPSSFVLSFYAIGVFLMASKRFGELRLFNNDNDKASSYRKSLSFYSEKDLLFVMIAAISAFSFLFGVLALKYNVDFVILLPMFIGWIIWYFQIAYEDNSIVKDPERIYEKKWFLAYSMILLSLFIFLLLKGKSALLFLEETTTAFL